MCLGYLVGEGKNSNVPAGDFQIEIAGSLFSVSVSYLWYCVNDYGDGGCGANNDDIDKEDNILGPFSFFF